MKSNSTSIKRILKAFKFSYDGFISAFNSEEAFRQDIIVFIVFNIIIFFLKITHIEKLLLSSSLFIIIIAELVNTAIEMTIDRISEQFHPLSKIAKDIGSCIVLISFIHAILIWSIIIIKNYFPIN